MSYHDDRIKTAEANLAAAEWFQREERLLRHRLAAENPNADRHFVGRFGRWIEPADAIREARREVMRLTKQRDSDSPVARDIARIEDFAMFSAAGNRSVRSRLCTLAKKCHTDKITSKSDLAAAARTMVAEIGSNKGMGEVHDTAVREVISDCLVSIAAVYFDEPVDRHESWDL